MAHDDSNIDKVSKQKTKDEQSFVRHGVKRTKRFDDMRKLVEIREEDEEMKDEEEQKTDTNTYAKSPTKQGMWFRN